MTFGAKTPGEDKHVGLSKAPQTEDQKLRGAWLWLVRLAALIGYSANIVPVIIGLPLAFANLQNFLPTAPFSRWTAGELENAISASGISANFIVAFFLIADLFIIATYWGISLLLLYRYSDRWFGLIVPYILFGIGVGFSIYRLRLEFWHKRNAGGDRLISKCSFHLFVASIFLFLVHFSRWAFRSELGLAFCVGPSFHIYFRAYFRIRLQPLAFPPSIRFHLRWLILSNLPIYAGF